ncbi:hypothetical protein GW17_00004969 [Ensete ventricosum]|nr:hypothetical protein GW17_00004969 [Ensete ventricosum]
MHRDLPPRHRGSRYHLYAPIRGRIIVFLKGCPSPLPSPSLRRRHRPAQAAAALATGITAPACGSPGLVQQPLVGWPLEVAPCRLVAYSMAPATTGHCKCHAASSLARERMPPHVQGALATADRPLAGGQAVASHPYKGPGCGQPPLQMA